MSSKVLLKQPESAISLRSTQKTHLNPQTTIIVQPHKVSENLRLRPRIDIACCGFSS